MKNVLTYFALSCVMCVAQNPANPSPEEKYVWHLEQEYWHYAKGVELDKYLALWHNDVVGWPSREPVPLHKNHMTDWVTDETSKGSTLIYELEPLAVQVTENVAITHYRVKYSWVDKNGKGQPARGRITHTWIKSGDTWQIIGGMSAPITLPATVRQ